MRSPLLLITLTLALAGPAAAQETREIYQPQTDIGYAQAVRVGNTIYVSGTIARGATLEDQLVQIYRRIGLTLRHFGADSSHIVRETAYTTDMDALERAIPARKRFYGDATPAATWVQISRLLTPSALIEIEVTAVLP